MFSNATNNTKDKFNGNYNEVIIGNPFKTNHTSRLWSNPIHEQFNPQKYHKAFFDQGNITENIRH
jgi:hypothetical protein